MAPTDSELTDPRAYRRLATTIRQQITNGTLQHGQPTPSITSLSKEHGHARQTCGKAQRMLEDEGLFLVPDDDPPGLVALTRLQVLNTVLLAASLDGRAAVHVPYEAAVRSPGQVLASLAQVVPELAGRLGTTRGVSSGSPSPPRPGNQDGGIYSTATSKKELVAYLSETEAAGVKEAAAAALAAAASMVPAAVGERAAAWLGGSQHYRLTPARQSAAGAPAKPRQPRTRTSPGYVRRGPLEWRNLLVTNAEFTAMLNELGQAGLASSHAGAPLLVCQMPHERGGLPRNGPRRLHRRR
jgi:hypothetical protein